MNQEEIIKRLNTLKQLRDDGILTPEEVEQEKNRILHPDYPEERPNIPFLSNQTRSPAEEKAHSPFRNKRSFLFILCGCLAIALGVLLTVLLQKSRVVHVKKEVSIPASSSTETNVENEQQEIIRLVNLWCDSHSDGNVQMLSQIYGPQVKFYQSDYSREKVLDAKQKAFAKPGDHRQSAADFRFEERNDGYIRVYFSKNTIDKIYPSYLGVQKNGGVWRIVEESDLITDKNLAKRKLAPMTLLAEDTQFGYYTKVIQKAADEFDSDAKELYRYNKQTYDVEYLFTGGGEKATTLSPLRPGEGNVIVYGIDSVHIISPSRIVVSGSSAPNLYSYLFDTESKKCSDLGGYFSKTKKENGQDVIIVIATRFGDRGREHYERIIDYNGNYLHEGENFGSIYDN